jgi:hypothetical protein
VPQAPWSAAAKLPPWNNAAEAAAYLRRQAAAFRCEELKAVAARPQSKGEAAALE